MQSVGWSVGAYSSEFLKVYFGRSNVLVLLMELTYFGTTLSINWLEVIERALGNAKSYFCFEFNLLPEAPRL
jgi:hypothetical protein